VPKCWEIDRDADKQLSTGCPGQVSTTGCQLWKNTYQRLTATHTAPIYWVSVQVFTSGVWLGAGRTLWSRHNDVSSVTISSDASCPCALRQKFPIPPPLHNLIHLYLSTKGNNVSISSSVNQCKLQKQHIQFNKGMKLRRLVAAYQRVIQSGRSQHRQLRS
jgi:hypothetical protein